MYRKELLKGSTETFLLALLSQEPMYGYHIAKEMERRSSGYFRFKEGTLYPALHRLESDGLVVGRWELSPGSQPRRYYHLTVSGNEAFAGRLEEWSSFSKAANLILQPHLV